MDKSTSIYTNTMDPLGSPRHHGIPPPRSLAMCALGAQRRCLIVIVACDAAVLIDHLATAVCTESGSLVRELGNPPKMPFNSGLGIIVVYPERMVNDQVNQVD